MVFKKKAFHFLKDKKMIAIFLAIFMIGIFFRAYNFSDWLLFKGDAFRDAVLVRHAIEDGPGSLPLMGPRAGGTTLRLGPIFYYFQYFSGTIFQSAHPAVLALHDLFFSILVIPLSFVFFRLYFSKKLSLLLMAMVSLGFMATEYGRFSWNPNSTPFFTILFFLSLIKTYNSQGRNRYLWSAISGLAISVASQLHFSAFLGLPIIMLIFTLWQHFKKKNKISLSVAAVFFAVVIMAYVPIFINEYLSRGYNTSQFFKAIAAKGESGSVLTNIKVEVLAFAHLFLRISAGVVDSGKLLVLFSMGLFGAGYLVNYLLFRKENNFVKKEFLFLSLVTIGVFVAIYFPLAHSIEKPRFFLPMLVSPLLLLGFLIDYFSEKGSGFILKFLMAVCIVFISSNVRSTVLWYSELKKSELTVSASEIGKNIKGKNLWWTWAHFEKAAKYMDKVCAKERPIYFVMAKDVAEYDHSIEYAVNIANKNRLVFPISQKKMSGPVPEGCYFVISSPSSKFPKDVTLGESVDEGNIIITKANPTIDYSIKDEIDEEDEEFISVGCHTADRSRRARFFWSDLCI